jgi:hypothetical protein
MRRTVWALERKKYLRPSFPSATADGGGRNGKIEMLNNTLPSADGCPSPTPAEGTTARLFVQTHDQEGPRRRPLGASLATAPLRIRKPTPCACPKTASAISLKTAPPHQR